jgi:hypothetical protein
MGENQAEWVNMVKHGNTSEYWGSFTCWWKSSENVFGNLVNSSEVAGKLLRIIHRSACAWDKQGNPIHTYTLHVYFFLYIRTELQCYLDTCVHGVFATEVDCIYSPVPMLLIWCDHSLHVIRMGQGLLKETQDKFWTSLSRWGFMWHKVVQVA